MIEADFNTFFDISSVIWDKDDYAANTDEYYNLVLGVTKLLDYAKANNLKILVRNELLDQMTNGFPFDCLPNDFYEFGNIVYSFLADRGSNFITYDHVNVKMAVSKPDQLKCHYNTDTKNEINYLISRVHSDNETASKYFTFNYLWNGGSSLKTENEDKTNTYETILVDSGTQFTDFFKKLTPEFDHNPKHDHTPYNTKEYWQKSDDRDGFVSRLSCYNGQDTIFPSRILEKRYPFLIESCYFGYDYENEVFVVFRRTHNDRNVFHGYDENNLNKIPREVRTHFNK